MITEKKFCKVCDVQIHGRRDKLFCSDYCRSQYFNNNHADLSNFMRRVNYTIRKNRSILSRLNPTGKARTHKLKLKAAGLNFDYFTNIYRTKSGKVYYFCYDQGYLELEDEYYALVIRENYVG